MAHLEDGPSPNLLMLLKYSLILRKKLNPFLTR